jgi:hypothetical protein
MVSYFLGMALCKLFAARLLRTPWLLHLDVFRARLNPTLLGRSRPDLVGQDSAGNWHSFESKGRSSGPSLADKAKAKVQAQRLTSVGRTNCTLHIGSFAFFRNGVLEFYWCDPSPQSEEPFRLPEPRGEWRYYFEPALSLTEEIESDLLTAELEMADVKVTIHPAIRKLLRSSNWFDARRTANDLRSTFSSEGYQPDGIKVEAGESWLRSFKPGERK